MDGVPVTDREMLARWEWFRRAAWEREIQKRNRMEGTLRAFVALLGEMQANVALETDCFLGWRTLMLQEMGASILGCDASGFAVECARMLARGRGADTSFFEAAMPRLSEMIPHPFDAILARELAREPSWEVLLASMRGVFESLRPGGCLVFPGAPEGCEADGLVRQQATRLQDVPRERIRWSHREGRVFCAKVVETEAGADYVDERILFVIDEGGEPRLETTTRRIPAYWGWAQWRELAAQAGFGHLETRRFEGLGAGGGPVLLNVAWKGGSHASGDGPSLSAYEE